MRITGRRHARGFTLIELIVVILILGILAAIGVVAYNEITDRAHVAAAQTNLRNIATAVVAHHTLQQEPELSRIEFLAALEDMSARVTDGLNAAPSWTFYGYTHSPSGPGEYAVGFDSGDGTDAGDVGGTRAVVMTSVGKALYARVIVYGAPDTTGLDGTAGVVPAGATPEGVLDDPSQISDPTNPAPGPGNGGGSGPSSFFGVTAYAWSDVAWDGSNNTTAGIFVAATALPSGAPPDGSTFSASCTGPGDPADDYTFGWGRALLTSNAVDLAGIPDLTFSCTATVTDTSGTLLASRTFALTPDGPTVDIVATGDQQPGDIAIAEFTKSQSGTTALIRPTLNHTWVPETVTTVRTTCTQDGSSQSFDLALIDDLVWTYVDGGGTPAQIAIAPADPDAPTVEPIECVAVASDAGGQVVRTYVLWNTVEAPFTTWRMTL